MTGPGGPRSRPANCRARSSVYFSLPGAVSLQRHLHLFPRGDHPSQREAGGPPELRLVLRGGPAVYLMALSERSGRAAIGRSPMEIDEEAPEGLRLRHSSVPVLQEPAADSREIGRLERGQTLVIDDEPVPGAGG